MDSPLPVRPSAFVGVRTRVDENEMRDAGKAYRSAKGDDFVVPPPLGVFVNAHAVLARVVACRQVLPHDGSHAIRPRADCLGENFNVVRVLRGRTSRRQSALGAARFAPASAEL